MTPEACGRLVVGLFHFIPLNALLHFLTFSYDERLRISRRSVPAGLQKQWPPIA